MSMVKLAFLNVKNSYKNYSSLILSLAFTIVIFFNFRNIIDSDLLTIFHGDVLRNIETIIDVISVVLICFMIFFIWYSTNVFLAKRKKEIGIYIFMGLTNQKIGRMYAIETMLIGLAALCLGGVFGILTTQLFQMILFQLSDISVDLQLGFSLFSLCMVGGLYLIIYMVFVIKGYVNIVRSSVLEMVSATRQNEVVKQNDLILSIKTLLGLIILGTGYYVAIKKGGTETISNAMLAVILVIIGVYFVFGGCLPLLFQTLAKNKQFLYKKQRNLWINNVIFRMKKNYRTYAMVAILMICSVSALATGFAMKERYDGIVHFRSTYTFQVMTIKHGLYEEYETLIEADQDIAYGSQISFLQLDPSVIQTQYAYNSFGILAYSNVKQLAQDTGLEFPFEEPQSQEYINVDKKTLLTLITDNSKETITIDGITYTNADYTTIPYLGYLQEKTSFYMVSDETYNMMSSLGQEYTMYNYKLTDVTDFQSSVKKLQSNDNTKGLIKLDPGSDELQWVRILYSLCIFMFMVFIMASGSIIFMKLYNDAFEEQERYLVLQKIGISKQKLKQAIMNELRFAYVSPLIVMAISSYFSVQALSNMVQEQLLMVNIISVIIIVFFFYVCYRLSIRVYMKNVHIK